jgi:hypothetical protein
VKKKNMNKQRSFLKLNIGAGSNFNENNTGKMKPVKGLKVAPVKAMAALMFGIATERM